MEEFGPEMAIKNKWFTVLVPLGFDEAVISRVQCIGRCDDARALYYPCQPFPQIWTGGLNLDIQQRSIEIEEDRADPSRVRLREQLRISAF
jgi:hypothetical protein